MSVKYSRNGIDPRLIIEIDPENGIDLRKIREIDPKSGGKHHSLFRRSIPYMGYNKIVSDFVLLTK
jgi:hypothetical protein